MKRKEASPLAKSFALLLEPDRGDETGKKAQAAITQQREQGGSRSAARRVPRSLCPLCSAGVTVDCNPEDPEWASLYALKHLHNKTSHAALNKILRNVEGKDRGDVKVTDADALGICVPGAFEGEAFEDQLTSRSTSCFIAQLLPSAGSPYQDLR